MSFCLLYLLHIYEGWGRLHRSAPVGNYPIARSFGVMLKNMALGDSGVFSNPTLTYLYNLQGQGIQPGLERMEALLSLLGNPHRRFPSVHIAGTNGKGSTAAMVARIFTQAKYRTGLYTSPHLIDVTERITIGGVPIPSETVFALTEQLREVIRSASLTITFFEFITALAFCYFAEAGVDIAVIEVGLGGLFDATNLVLPRVTAITTIDLDHQQYLGSTLTAIAREKAGIIKKGVPVVTGVTEPAAFRIIEEKAKSQDAPLIQLGRDITVSGDNPRFIYRGLRERTVSCPLRGKHQVHNAGVAIGMIEAMQSSYSDFSLTDQDILEGIRHVEWPGRLQMIQTNPLILLDGAHNPAGAIALSDFLRTVDPDRMGRHILMMGMLNDKDIRGLFEPLMGWADEIVLTRPHVDRAVDPQQLRAALEKPIPVTLQAEVPQAIQDIESKIRPQDTLVITGSLYVVGEALAYFKGVAPSSIRG